MTEKGQGKQYEFDIAKNRLEFLGSLVAEKGISYYRFNMEKSSQSAEHLVSVLRTLLVEIDEEGRENGYDVDAMYEKIDTLERRIQNESSKFQFKTIRSKIEDVNQTIEKIRKDAGLDIPSKTRKEKGQEMLK